MVSSRSAITFFIDRSLGGVTVANAIRPLMHGERESLVVHDGQFPQDTDDQTWLEHVGRAEWVCFSKDERIGTNILELAAIVKYRVRIFLLARQDLRGEVMGAAFATALPQIRKIVAKYSPPFLGTVHTDGSVSKLLTETKLVKRLERHGIYV